MTELEGIIRFWESTLKDSPYLMEPSSKAMVESTILHLKELREKEEVKGSSAH